MDHLFLICMKDNIKIPNWLKEKDKDLIDGYIPGDILEFDQTWGSTALGFLWLCRW